MNLDKIEQLAKAATPGPWYVSDGRYDSGDVLQVNPRSPLGRRVVGSSSGPGDSGGCGEDDAAFIASVSPDVVFKLIAVVRAAQALHEGAEDADRYLWATLDALK